MDESGSAGIVVLILLALVLIALLGTAVFLLLRLWKMLAVVRSDDMPMAGKVTFWAALAYTVFPVDVLLDPVYLDDIGVLTGALAYLTHLVKKYHVAPAADEAVEAVGTDRLDGPRVSP